MTTTTTTTYPAYTPIPALRRVMRPSTPTPGPITSDAHCHQPPGARCTSQWLAGATQFHTMLACERRTSRATPTPTPFHLPRHVPLPPYLIAFAGSSPTWHRHHPHHSTHTTHTTPAPAPSLPLCFFSSRARCCRCPFQPAHTHQSPRPNATRGTPQSPSTPCH